MLTLEEVALADIILHVQDVSNKNYKFQKDNVIKVLKTLVDQDTLEDKTINILNKSDLLTKEETRRNRTRIKKKWYYCYFCF